MLSPLQEMRVYVALLCTAFAIVAVHSLDNGLGRTPAMGFNTWNAVRDCDRAHVLAPRDVVAIGVYEQSYTFPSSTP